MTLQKVRQLISLALVCCGLLSCSNDKDGDIVVTVTPDESYVVPDAIKTCLEIEEGSTTESYSASSVKFRDMSLEWKESLQVEIIRITLKFRSGALSGGEKKVDITGDELTALLTHGTQTPILTTAGTLTTNPDCGLRAGNLSFVPSSGDAPVSVSIDVVGIATEEDGDTYPVYGSGVAFATYLSPN